MRLRPVLERMLLDPVGRQLDEGARVLVVARGEIGSSQIVGAVPTHLSAFGSSFISEIGGLNDFDNVVASLVFPGGVTATIDINRQSVYGYDQRLEAFGSGGMLQAENIHATSVTHESSRGFLRPTVDYSFPTRYRAAYIEELQCFVRCARGEQQVPI